MNWLNKNLTIKRIFLIGLLVRLLVMPFFGHDDIFAVHRRVGNIICGENSVFDHSSFGVHAIESAASVITLPIIPCDNLMEIQRSNIDVNNLNRMLFFFKLPYLFFEIGFWYLMWKMLKSEDRSKNKKIAIFLALNPVMIYSVYMFGRFESYAMFFIALIFWIMRKYKDDGYRSIIITSAIMALIFTIRLSYIFVFPALVFAYGGWSKKGVLTLLSTLGIFAVLKQLPRVFASQHSLLPESNWISTGTHPNYIFQSVIDNGQTEIYIFFLLLAIVFIRWFDQREYFNKLDKVTLFSLFSSLILLSFYFTSSFHPQYLTWLLPFLLILILKDKRNILWNLFWLSMPVYLLYIFNWGNDVTFGLASPVSAVFNSFNPDWLFPVYDHSRWANIGKSVFAGFDLYMIYYLLKNYADEK